MYFMGNFGERITALRKKQNLTQEELAAKLGITSQAVSKWENNIGFPDITLLPQIAETLEIDIEYLFGKEKENGRKIQFAKKHEGLPIVAEFRGAACYSDKESPIIDSNNVKFADGSTADLADLSCVNVGSGEIKFVQADKYEASDLSGGPTEKSFEFDGISSLDVEISICNVTVTQSGGGKTFVAASGSPRFIAGLTVGKNGSALSCVNRRQGDSGIIRENNKLDIRLGNLPQERLGLKIDGSGTVASDVAFGACDFAINGSGNITQKRGCGECSLKINGSGRVSLEKVTGLFSSIINGSGTVGCDECGGLAVKISGSGDIGVSSVSSSDPKNFIDADINGSGNIKVAEGFADKLNVRIWGSGDFKGRGLTVNELDLRIAGMGDFLLGRVIEKSTEKVSTMSKVKILNRGK